MRITKMVMAGSLESNDVLITLKPGTEDVQLTIESIVEKQFGDRIRKIVEEKITEYSISSGYISVQDRGALDCTLKARLDTAILRAKEGL